MTLTEKILAKAAVKESVRPGEIVEAKVGVAMANDALGSLFFPSFEKLELKIWDKERVVIAVDHYAPPSNLDQARRVMVTRRFVERLGVKYFYDSVGVSHPVMIQRGHVLPGEVIVGTDSHSVSYGALGAFGTGIGSTEMAWVFSEGSLWFKVPQTIRFDIEGELGDRVHAKDLILSLFRILGFSGATYKALEYGGATVRKMDVHDRIVLCNMAVDVGAKNAIIEPDEKAAEYLHNRATRSYTMVKADSDAEYEQRHRIDAGKVEPLVACPPNSANVHPVSDLKGLKVDQAFLGSCTGAWWEDLQAAAVLLKNRKVHSKTRLLVVPASQEVYNQVLQDGTLKAFCEAGAIVCNPGCGPCGGGHMGLLGEGERCIGSHNRNFPGRMGHPKSEVYLASPLTVAASAIKGEIADPREI